MLQPLADIFLRMIKMILAPLIFSTLVVGIAGHGNLKELGRTSLKTFIYFEIVTTLALIIGLVVANTLHLGEGVQINTLNTNMNELSKLTQANPHLSFSETFVHMFPTSVVDAMARCDMLQLVIFSVIFALAMTVAGDKSKPVYDVLSSLSVVMFKFTRLVMLFAPVGVFAAIAHTVSQNGIGVLGIYIKLILALYFALLLFLFGVLMAACRIAKIPFFKLLYVIRDPALLAFSTATSEAALPKAMEIMEDFGVPRNIVSFVMPTGYTFNLDGSTLYLTLATIFIANLSGIHLSFEQQLMIMFALMLTSKGIAGVPRVALVILTGTLMSFHIPVAGVAVILGIDHILDMGRTTINLVGNCIATAVVARWENCFDYKKMNEYLEFDREDQTDILKPLMHEHIERPKEEST